MPAVKPPPSRVARASRGASAGAAKVNGSQRGDGNNNDVALRGAARGGSLNIVSAVCNQAALFLVTAGVAKYLGKVALGEYALGLAVLSLVGAFALFGFQMTLTRYVAVHLADEDPARLRGTVVFGLAFSFCLSVVLAAGVAILAAPLAAVFGQPDFAGDLRLVALAIPAATLRDACLAAVQGWRTQRAFALVTWVYEPLVRLGFTGAAIALGLGLRGAFIAILIGCWSAAGLAFNSLRRRLRKSTTRRSIVETRTLLRFSSVSLGTGMASVGLVWADLIMLGILSDTGSTGVYTVSTRLVNLAVFVMLPINAAFAPQFAHFLHRNEHGTLGRAYRSATTWILRLSLPAFVILIIFPENLLDIFGRQYTVGAAVTVILAVGQLVNAATGPCGTLLNMSGRVGVNMLNNFAVLILNIALNLILIPRWGIIGAAISWSLSLSAVNVARVVEVKIILNASPFGRSTTKSVAAAAAAAAVAVTARLGLTGWAEQLAVGLVTMLSCYIVVQFLLGFDAEDRAFISSLIPRRSPAAS